MKKTCGKILVALLAAMLLAAGCRSDDDDDLSPAPEYKVLAGRLVWCAESLERATVPESASSIGNNAFRNCPALTSVVIPPSVEKIGSSTFYGVAIREIEYKDTMRAWDALARESGIVATLAKITVYCTDGIWGAGMYDWEITDGVLTRYCGDAAAVTLPHGVTNIGENAFKDCTNLTSVEIPASVESIGTGAIPAGTAVTYHGTKEQWESLAADAGLEGLTVFIIDENGTLTGYCGSAADIALPDGVKGIAGGAFAGHTELERVTIPAGVTAIETGAFGESGITEITFGGTVADWDAVVEAGGIAAELDGITVTCADGTWTPGHTHEWSETYTDGGDGTHHQTCAGCGRESKPEAHTWGDETCTDAGHTKECTLCSYSASKPHSWSDYTDDGTDTHSRTCAVEGFEAHSESAAHDYEYKDNGDDTHTITCTKCAYSKTEEHRYEDGTCLDCKCPRPTTVYVASTGSDDNSGSRTKPFATIQKAIDTVIAINDGTSEYMIYVDGTLQCDDSTYVGTYGMADFSALTKKLTLTIKALSGTATLDTNQKSRVIYAAPASGTLNLTLENLAITGGNATGNGGGILFNGKTLEMTGGEVIGCEANNGGGVYITGGTFTMNGGTISGNTTSGNGGGVCVSNSGTFTMEGGTISGNTASGTGGGVCVTSGARFTMGGAASIPAGDDGKNDVYLASGRTIAVASNLTATPPVATITPYDYTVGIQVLSGSAATLAANCGKFEMSQAGWKIDEAGKLAVASDIYVSEGGDDTNGKGSQAKPFATLQKAFNLIQTLNLSTVSYTIHISGTVKGKSELSADASAQKISITGTTGAKLDGIQALTTLLTVSCSAPVEITNLTLTNNRKSAILVKSGANVTLGEGAAVFDNNFAMGGVDIVSGGTFTMKSGATISENKNHVAGSGGGGGVRNNGTFIMEGGTISENYVSQANIHGGGVYSSGTFIMKGGEISGNYTSTSYSTGCGGGVYIAGGTFEMTGGTISGNTASSAGKGGGVYVSSGTFTMGGSASIPAGDDGKNDVYLVNGRTIAIASDLTAATPVATITPSAYTAGRQVLSAGGAVTQGICDKFAVTKEADGTKWKVAPDDVKGVLKEDIVSTGGGGISVTIPGVGTYTFKVESGGTEVVDGTKLQSGASVIFSEVRKDGVALTASDGTFSIEIRDEGGITFPNASATGFQCAVTVPVVPPIGMKMQVYVKVELTSGIVIDKQIAVTGP